MRTSRIAMISIASVVGAAMVANALGKRVPGLQ